MTSMSTNLVCNLPGQWRVLQSFTTLAKLSQYPPYFSVTSLGLVLSFFPPPQDLSHCENSVHGPHTQGTKKEWNNVKKSFKIGNKGCLKFLKLLEKGLNDQGQILLK